MPIWQRVRRTVNSYRLAEVERTIEELSDTIKSLVESSSREHAEILHQLQVYRAETDKRLDWLEQNCLEATGRTRDDNSHNN